MLRMESGLGRNDTPLASGKGYLPPSPGVRSPARRAGLGQTKKRRVGSVRAGDRRDKGAWRTEGSLESGSGRANRRRSGPGCAGGSPLAQDARLAPSPAAEGALGASAPRRSPPPRRLAACSGVPATAAQPPGAGCTNRGGAAGGTAGGREGPGGRAEPAGSTPRAPRLAPRGTPGGRVGALRTKRRPSPGATGGVTWPPGSLPRPHPAACRVAGSQAGWLVLGRRGREAPPASGYVVAGGSLRLASTPTKKITWIYLGRERTR